MTGAHLLIAAVIIVFVIAFIVTMLVLNANAKKIISTNTKLVENQNTLLRQNEMQGSELQKRMSELEEQKNELEEQKELIETLQRQQEELAEQLKHSVMDEVMQLREQTRQHREHIELTADMKDEELMAWIDQQMDETRLLYAAALSNDSYRKNFPFIQKKNLCLRGVALNCGIYDIVAAVNDGGHTDLFVGALLPRGGKPDELKLINSVDYVTKDFPPAFVMSCKGDFLFPQAPMIKRVLEGAGVLHEYKIYGTDAEPLWHVFHCDPKLQEAVACNDDECEFFRRLIAR